MTKAVVDRLEELFGLVLTEDGHDHTLDLLVWIDENGKEAVELLREKEE